MPTLSPLVPFHRLGRVIGPGQWWRIPATQQDANVQECGGHGSCHRASSICLCHVGYAGQSCELCAAGFVRSPAPGAEEACILFSSVVWDTFDWQQAHSTSPAPPARSLPPPVSGEARGRNATGLITLVSRGRMSTTASAWSKSTRGVPLLIIASVISFVTPALISLCAVALSSSGSSGVVST
jgi:Laminin EGF domain